MTTKLEIRSILRTGILLVLGASLLSLATYAGVPEPDTVVFGSIALDGQFATAADTDVVVEVRDAATGPVLTSYRMGESPAAGNRYVLRVKSEHAAPVLEEDAVALGSTVYLTVRDANGPRDTATLTLTVRGRFVQLDFGDVDSDGDGMSDRFEQQYFGSTTGGNPNADSDGDGRPNGREFLQGTNPNVADGRHPADLAPADDALTIKEMTDYSLAWQTGAASSIEPTNIPIAYVTRAGALWKSGEIYIFQNVPPTNAPNWWVNPPLAGGGGSLVAASVGAVPDALVAATGTLPPRYSNGVPLAVEISVQPRPTVVAYAVEDRVPEGWATLSFSHGGQFDSVNRKVKWGPFFDPAPRVLTYHVIPIGPESATVQFIGTASFDGWDVEIGGRRRTSTGATQTQLAAQRGAGNALKIALRGAPNARYVIEMSDDLVHWTAWTPAAADANGALELNAPMQGPARYYRARVESNGP